MKQGEKDHILLRLAREMKPIAWWLALGAALDALAVMAAVLAPEILGGIVQRLYDFRVGGSAGALRKDILGSLGLLLLAYGVSGLLGYLNMLLMNKVVSRHFTCNIRIQISEKLRHHCQTIPVRFYCLGEILLCLIDGSTNSASFIRSVCKEGSVEHLRIMLIGLHHHTLCGNRLHYILALGTHCKIRLIVGISGTGTDITHRT